MSATESETKAFYTVAELMARWSVSRMTIHRLTVDGRIKKSRIRGAVRYSAATIQSYEKKLS